MGHYTCEFGVIHKTCRCPTPHTIKCDKVEMHGPGNEATKTGRWVKKSLPRHECQLPEWSKGINRGDQWQCNHCQRVYEVTHSSYEQGSGGMLDWKRKRMASNTGPN